MKIDQVIRTYKANRGDTTLHGYLKLLHYALQGYKKLKVSTGFDEETVKLNIGGLKQSKLPDGYLQWSQVSVLSGDRLINMVPDKSIINSSFEPREPITNEYEYYDDTYLSYLAGFVKTQNTVLTNGAGYFNVDEKAGLIQFDARLTLDHVYLTYITNKFKPSAKTEVHPFVADALVEHIRWYEARYDRRFGDAAAETMMRKKEFLNSLDMLVANMSTLNAELFVDILNRSTSRAPIRNR